MTLVSAEPDPANAPVRVQWPGVESLQIHMANQFLFQIDPVGTDPDLLILTVGQLAPPALLGTDDEKVKTFAAMGYQLNVTPLARYGITPRRLDELIETLQKMQTIFKSGHAPTITPVEG
jgi:hypothetical protein